jgi:hypothetical protein
VTTTQLHLTFDDALALERTVATLRTSFPLHVEIRRANVDEQASWFIVDLTGDADDIERSVAWLLDRGVSVDRIAIDG